MKLRRRAKPFCHIINTAKAEDFYPYFRPISRSWGPEVESGGKRLIMVGSNDYLGLSHDPRVMEAAEKAIRVWGTGPGGSRLLSGNLTLHERLEERLAAFVGKKTALVHTTGFMTNLGVIGCLLTNGDIALCDRENHASIFEGCRASGAKLVTFTHNDAKSAEAKLRAAAQRDPEATSCLVVDGVFSMSGDVANLPEFAKLKDEHPRLLFYLDDAHGLGVLGPGGRGTAAHYGMTARVDFLMGTFSKALASIGGFVASDDEELICYLRHHSKTEIFSAAPPASNAATVLACLDVLEQEPDRVENLRRITHRARAGYQRIGFNVPDSPTPIIPILIGTEYKAYEFARDLFENGVFAFPAVFPAVPKGEAIIRTAFMSTHEDYHVDRVLEVLAELAWKHNIINQQPPRQEHHVKRESQHLRVS